MFHKAAIKFYEIVWTPQNFPLDPSPSTLVSLNSQTHQAV